MGQTFQIKNMRCFANSGALRVAPLTLLVGENSTGKSTILAAYRLFWDTLFGYSQSVFNSEPFYLGTYNEIAHYRGGKAGRAKFFSLEMKLQFTETPRGGSPRTIDMVIEEKFSASGAQPVLDTVLILYPGYEIRIGIARKQIATIELTTPYGDGKKEVLDISGVGRRPRLLRDSIIFDLPTVNYYVFQHSLRMASKDAKDGRRVHTDIAEIFDRISRTFETGPQAIAPIRTQPKRTYDPINDTPTPEGAHVPVMLNRMSFTSPAEWQEFKTAFDAFGVASGLFSDMEVRTLGKHESDPFQLKFKIHGPSHNIIDVGYGISQVLPLLADGILARPDQIFLIQQPEVHLHPRSQAELASFIVKLLMEKRARFIIETHSDYIIDRFRSEVRSYPEFTSDKISIVYLERHGLEVGAANISIDENGNLVDVPPGYRSFFLNEDRRLLGL